MFVTYSIMCVVQCCSAITEHWIVFVITRVFVGLSAGMHCVFGLFLCPKYTIELQWLEHS